MAKYLGNPKYIRQLEEYNGAKNATINAQRLYINLACQDKVALSQAANRPACCPSNDVVWNTWENHDWNIDSHAWNTTWSV